MKEREERERDIQKETKEREQRERERERDIQREMKEREEGERDIQREMEERRWTKEKEFELEVERERIDFDKVKAEMGVKLKSYVEANTEDTVVHNYGNTVKLLKLELKKFNGNILNWQEFWDAFIQPYTKTKDYKR